jgi:LmbE family N-acetylglucosaminyl deacetylase
LSDPAEYRFADPAQLFPGTILIIAPHMDDEVLACGGTIARLPHPGRVHVVYATDGARSYTPVVPWMDSTSPALSSARRAESRSALERLGVSPGNLHFLDFPDGQLEQHTDSLERAFVDLLRKLQPDHVLTPFRFDRHPDHLAVNHVAHSALQREGSRAQLFEYFVYYRWRMLPRRDVRAYVRNDQLLAVDIASVAGRKRMALDCFKSQTTQYYPWQDRPILSQTSLEEVCRYPEVFLKYDPGLSGVKVFTAARGWIRFVHAFEPRAKRHKDQVMALVRRGTRWHAGRAN